MQITYVVNNHTRAVGRPRYFRQGGVKVHNPAKGHNERRWHGMNRSSHIGVRIMRTAGIVCPYGEMNHTCVHSPVFADFYNTYAQNTQQSLRAVTTFVVRRKKTRRLCFPFFLKRRKHAANVDEKSPNRNEA